MPFAEEFSKDAEAWRFKCPECGHTYILIVEPEELNGRIACGLCRAECCWDKHQGLCWSNGQSVPQEKIIEKL
jgi:transcription elongation factor Elf1